MSAVMVLVLTGLIVVPVVLACVGLVGLVVVEAWRGDFVARTLLGLVLGGFVLAAFCQSLGQVFR